MGFLPADDPKVIVYVAVDNAKGVTQYGGTIAAPIARNILIEKNLRLVAHIAKKYSITDMDIDDIMSIGTIGLIKAIDTFEMDKKSGNKKSLLFYDFFRLCLNL